MCDSLCWLYVNFTSIMSVWQWCPANCFGVSTDNLKIYLLVPTTKIPPPSRLSIKNSISDSGEDIRMNLTDSDWFLHIVETSQRNRGYIPATDKRFLCSQVRSNSAFYAESRLYLVRVMNALSSTSQITSWRDAWCRENMVNFIIFTQ
jgi:hypothetical protein